MNKKLILAVAISVIAFAALFGCTGTQTTGAADGDFKSLNVRGGPSTFSGPVSASNSVNLSGNVTIAGGVITISGFNATVADNSITTAKIVDGAVTTGKILNGTIIGADIANSTITDNKLALNYVTAQGVSKYGLDSINGVVLAGQTTATYSFNSAFGAAPMVVVSPTVDLTGNMIHVSTVNASQVTFTMNATDARNVTFNAIAMGTK